MGFWQLNMARTRQIVIPGKPRRFDMTLREFYLQRRKAELPAFMKVLKALPKEQLSYKPDERSPSAEQLVWTLIGSLRACLEIVADGKTAWKPVPPPPLDEMIEMFERFSNELTNSVSQNGRQGTGDLWALGR